MRQRGLEALGERRGFDTALVEDSLRKYYDLTLADRIAELALADPRARRAEVTVEKLDVFPDADGAGVTVTRRRDG